MRVTSLLALAIGLFATADPVRGEDNPKDSKAIALFGLFREQMNQGKFDVASNFLQQFLDANPNDNDFMELEKKYSTTVFLSLRNVPRWSDVDAVDKKARANVDEIIKRDKAASQKLLYDPARVSKYIRNLGATYEERVYAEMELRRTGDYAIPFMVDELRNTRDPNVFSGLIETIGVLEGTTIAGWVAALDGLTPAQQSSVVASIVLRRDVLNLQTSAQSSLAPYLWRILAQKDSSPTLRQVAVQLLAKLYPGMKVDAKLPEVELLALARTYYDHTARFAGARDNGDGSPKTVPIWTWDAATSKLVKVEEVPLAKAEEYFGLRYTRWVLEINPGYDQAQGLLVALAAEKAIERAKFGNLAKSEPAVFKMLSDAPSRVLADQLERGLNQKKASLALAMMQVLGDRADRNTDLFLKGLSFPDPQVQFAAATALLRSPFPVPASARPLIVDILRRAAAVDAGVPEDSKGTALLADSNRIRADAVAMVLRGLGYQVEIVTTGRDLLRRIGRASDFDLILIDHHTPNPELIDLIGQIHADSKASNRPTFVIASPDKTRPPSFDQLVVRLAALIASTENDQLDIPPAFVRPPVSDTSTLEYIIGETKKNADKRDRGYGNAAVARLARLIRLVDTTGIKLTDAQRLLLNLRMELLTYTILKMQYPYSEENAPETFLQVAKVRRQLEAQPLSPPFGAGIPTNDILKLIERFEADLDRVPARKKEFEKLYGQINPGDFGMTVESFRDPLIEARLSRTLRNYPDVHIIPEPYGPFGFVADLKIAYRDPEQAPRDPAEKKAAQKQAVNWLRKMAIGDITGYEIASAEKELRAALRVDDLADSAIDAVARFSSAGAQEDLLVYVLNGTHPVPLRTKAADAVIRHIQTNGNSIPKTLLPALIEQSGMEADLTLRGKLLTLKGMLAFQAGDFVNQLKNYNPPLVPPPAAKAPEKEPAKK